MRVLAVNCEQDRPGRTKVGITDLPRCVLAFALGLAGDRSLRRHSCRAAGTKHKIRPFRPRLHRDSRGLMPVTYQIDTVNAIIRTKCIGDVTLETR